MSPTSAGAAHDDSDEAAKLRRAEALEKRGNFSEAFNLYREILAATADPSDISARMGRLAVRAGNHGVAESLLLAHVEGPAPRKDVIIELAFVQAEQGGFDRAQATLTKAIQTEPGASDLWLALGRLLCVQGRHAEAVVFLEEALRLDAGSATVRDVLADVLLLIGGDPDRALAMGDEARAAASPEQLSAVAATQAARLLGLGRLDAGWNAFAAVTTNGPAVGVTFRVAAPRWTPGRREAGRVVLFGEERLADEILLASLLPSLLTTDSKFILALDERWAPLAARSFPEAPVARRLSRTFAGRLQHAVALDSVQVHAGELVSAWAPLRDLLPKQRAALSDFSPAAAYLRPDPVRIAHWRQWLEGLGPRPKVGLRWRPDADQPPWAAPPSAALSAALAGAEVQLVALAATIETADAGLAARLHVPPGLDDQNLDDLAALATALDAVVGPPGVAAYLAAGAGARTFILAPPHHWAMLGSGGYPWFKDARAFRATAPNDWSAALAELSDAVAGLTTP